MRVKDRNGKMMNPEAFLKFVKKAGYIEKLDWMILSLSFMFISNNDTQGSISINVNPNTIQDEKFVEKIKTLSQIHQVDPRKIIIELLEYESSINVVHTNQVIREMKALGFRIAIDDFPSGYNTLGDISKFLDIDIIKIDGPHVMEIFKVCSSCHAVRECLSSLETSF
jgi:EAL domain-containing protein (putative c-di-GMP-specific phosphodiesterase class I)